jgi:biotin carboxyl carrier protein
MKYHLAGAYDSNIALLLTTGKNRLDSYQRHAEILRRTELRGKDLATNLEFHYGLVNWFIGQNINARPTTRFIVPYLTAVGRLKETTSQIDLNFAYAQIRAQHTKSAGEHAKAYAAVLDRKQSLILRPIDELFAQPHLLAGWLSLNRHNFTQRDGRIEWLCNPIEVLAELYHYLHMDFEQGKPAAYMIWDHDNELLQKALAFYAALKQKLGVTDYADLQKALSGARPAAIDAAQWDAAIAAHAGYQAGAELLSILPMVALDTQFFELKVNDDLTITIPAELLDKALQEKMAKVLVPPPMAKSDEILAVSGGMFYAREAPGMDSFVKEGSHFQQGQPLYIVEVMKMFNKVYAPFAGTIEKVMIDTDGVIIKKGQPLFKITPDEQIVIETPEEIAERKRARTAACLAKLI